MSEPDKKKICTGIVDEYTVIPYTVIPYVVILEIIEWIKVDKRFAINGYVKIGRLSEIETIKMFFGYFKLDKQRKIFQLIKNIYFDTNYPVERKLLPNNIVRILTSTLRVGKYALYLDKVKKITLTSMLYDNAQDLGKMIHPFQQLTVLNIHRWISVIKDIVSLDLSKLVGLKTLCILNKVECHYSMGGVMPLLYKGITNSSNPLQLESLSILGFCITKIDNLDKLVNLKILMLSSNRIKRIENLDCLTNLTDLDLSWNKIEKIENLNKLTKLLNLNLNNNDIVTFEGLNNQPKLQTLGILNIVHKSVKPSEKIAQSHIIEFSKKHNLSHIQIY